MHLFILQIWEQGKEPGSERCHIAAASLGAAELSLRRGGVDEGVEDDAAQS